MRITLLDKTLRGARTAGALRILLTHGNGRRSGYIRGRSRRRERIVDDNMSSMLSQTRDHVGGERTD